MTERRRSEPPEFTFGPRPTRREFLLYMGTLLAAAACNDDDGDGASTVVEAPPAPQLAGDPFTLGVASGDPLPDSVILWTRLAPAPLEDGGGMPDEDVPVIWEVARDAEFRRIATSGWLYASPEFAHSVHVDVRGLTADTPYFYRLRVGEEWTSPVGRTRTLPATNSSPASFRVALASCQNYRQGFYNAHHYLAQEDIDLVLWVGDYIYETGMGEPGRDVRLHEGSGPSDLHGYRRRYAYYKSDPNLVASHLQFPWVTTWDDHEVVNNYAGLFNGDAPTEETLIRRRAAYQAYYEHLPLRVPLPQDFGFLTIYRGFDVGDLASVSILDTRQYRDDQPCGDRIGACLEAEEPGRTILGAEQKQWLKSRLMTSDRVWNIIAQQVVFTPIRLRNAILNSDQWDGYAAERQELLDLFTELRNVLVLTGDIHAAGFASLPTDAADLQSETVAYEVVTTSISSGGDLALDALTDMLLPENPQVHHLNAGKRGYAVVEINRDSIVVEYRIVDTVLQPGATLATDAVFRIDRDTLTFETLQEPVEAAVL